jgi:hypothetical protein
MSPFTDRPVPWIDRPPQTSLGMWWRLVLILSLGCQPARTMHGVSVSPQTASFGVVENNGVISQEFQIHNFSPWSVRITDVRLLCGCTSVSLAKRVLDPGEVVVAVMSVDLKGKTGKQIFQARLLTDSKVAPFVDLILEGDVSVDRRDSEIFIPLGAFPPDVHISQVAWISKGGCSQARLTGIVHESGPLEASLEAGVEPRENALPVRISGRTPQAAGSFDTVATATLEAGPWQTAQIRFRGVVRSRWRYPRDVYLGFADDGNALQSSFSIRDVFHQLAPGPTVRDVEIADARPFLVGFQRISDDEMVFDVRLSPDAPIGASRRRLVITLVKDDDTREELSVNLYARRIE